MYKIVRKEDGKLIARELATKDDAINLLKNDGYDFSRFLIIEEDSSEKVEVLENANGSSNQEKDVSNNNEDKINLLESLLSNKNNLSSWSIFFKIFGILFLTSGIISFLVLLENSGIIAVSMLISGIIIFGAFFGMAVSLNHKGCVNDYLLYKLEQEE